MKQVIDKLTGMLLVISVLALQGAHAVNFDAGLDAYLNGEHKRAATIWRELAEAGDAGAQSALGNLYFKGEGVEQDYSKSVRWFQRAAKQGHPLAQFNLGNAYQNGRGIGKDERQSNLWWKRAAEQDVAAAQFNLALNYHYGRGTKQNTDSAIYWVRRAAANGHANAQALLKKSGLPLTDTGDSATQQPSSSTTQAEVVNGDSQQWLTQQPPKYYTLQLMVSSSARGANAMIRAHPFRTRVAAFRYINAKGLERHVVLHGSYASRDAAQQAIIDLPDSVRELKPLIQRFSAVQAKLR